MSTILPLIFAILASLETGSVAADDSSEPSAVVLSDAVAAEVSISCPSLALLTPKALSAETFPAQPAEVVPASEANSETIIIVKDRIVPRFIEQAIYPEDFFADMRELLITMVESDDDSDLPDKEVYVSITDNSSVTDNSMVDNSSVVTSISNIRTEIRTWLNASQDNDDNSRVVTVDDHSNSDNSSDDYSNSDNRHDYGEDDHSNSDNRHDYGEWWAYQDNSQDNDDNSSDGDDEDADGSGSGDGDGDETDVDVDNDSHDNSVNGNILINGSADGSSFDHNNENNDSTSTEVDASNSEHGPRINQNPNQNQNHGPMNNGPRHNGNGHPNNK